MALPRWRAWWLAKVSRLWLLIGAFQSVLDASERTLQRWTFAVTLFLFLFLFLFLASQIIL